MKISNRELTEVHGGFNSTLLNAMARLINTVLDWGRTIGSSIYRFKNKNYCR